MAIKDILVDLATGITDDATIAYAISLAQTFDAHVAGVAFVNDVIPPAMLAGEVPPTWIEELHEEAQTAAQAAVEKFEEAVKRAGVSAQAGCLPAGVTDPAELFGRMARRFDLSVVRQAEPGKATPAPLIIEAALFETGRPVLVVPYIQKGGVGLERIMVCWDGSRSAARAAGDALPFLERARTVEVVIVSEHGKSDEAPGRTSPSISPATGSQSSSRRSSRQTPRPPTCSCPMRPIPRRTSWCWAATATRACVSSSSAALPAASWRR